MSSNSGLTLTTMTVYTSLGANNNPQQINFSFQAGQAPNCQEFASCDLFFTNQIYHIRKEDGVELKESHYQRFTYFRSNVSPYLGTRSYCAPHSSISACLGLFPPSQQDLRLVVKVYSTRFSMPEAIVPLPQFGPADKLRLSVVIRADPITRRVKMFVDGLKTGLVLSREDRDVENAQIAAHFDIDRE